MSVDHQDRVELLSLDAVAYRRFGTKVVDAVSVRLRPGDRLVVTGPPGAGKSALLGLIDGTIPTSGGRIHLRGTDITGWTMQQRLAVGIIQATRQSWASTRHTVGGSLLLALHRHHRLGHGSPKVSPPVIQLMHAKALSLADSTGLARETGTRVNRLSEALCRRLDIALALARHAQVLLLDEPADGLSIEDTACLIELIAGLAPAVTTVVAEREGGPVAAIATRVLRLDHGRVVSPVES